MGTRYATLSGISLPHRMLRGGVRDFHHPLGERWYIPLGAVVGGDLGAGGNKWLGSGERAAFVPGRYFARSRRALGSV